MIEIDPMLAEKIAKIGLTEKEAKVYTALLISGGGFPAKIAEATKINRPTVYNILETLAVRGLVTELEKSKKRYYQIENPKNLERFAKSQITIANRYLERAQALLPVLAGLYAHADNKPIVRFFEGREGVLRVYESHVDVVRPYEMLSLSNTTDLMEFLSEEFRVGYIRKKEKLGITTRAILPDQELDIRYNEEIYGGSPKKIWPRLKHIPRSMFPFKSDVTIYAGNKVSIINFNEPKFSATIIEDQVVHDMMVMIFELAWRGADKPL